MEVFESPCFNTRIFLNLPVLKHRDSKYLCFIHGDFSISMYGNMEIGKYEQFCLTKPPCFNTQRFLNLRVLKHGDSTISMFWNTGIKFCIKNF